MALSSVVGVDHVVITVRDLPASARAWGALGFTISPPGTHSAVLGTGNYTIMFADDYLELLGVLNETPHNLPTRSFLAEREGIERTAFTARDAAKGAAEIRAMGYEPVGPISFGRPVPLTGGKTGEARFNVFRWPVDQKPGGMAIFACQHLTRENVWLPELQSHANGAIGIKRIEICSHDPMGAARMMASMIKRRESYSLADGLFTVRSGGARADFTFTNPAGLAARYPEAARAGATMTGASALVLKTSSLKAAKAALGAAAVVDGPRVIAPASRANGVIVAFEE